MAISQDLFLAILAMDSYNRGYGAGLADEATDDPDGLGENGQIGTATITRTSATLVDENGNRLDQAAGFYAVAYTVGAGVDGLADGTTVISYRGTDVFLTEYPSVDIPIHTGRYSEEELQLAAQFRRAVGMGPGVNDVILTGHSLGGALAGFTSALFGDLAVSVDHIGFYNALENFLDDWQNYRPYLAIEDIFDAWDAYVSDHPEVLGATFESTHTVFDQIWIELRGFGFATDSFPNSEAILNFISSSTNFHGYYLEGSIASGIARTFDDNIPAIQLDTSKYQCSRLVRG